MHRSTWKAIERLWATRIGGTRVPITGRQRGDVPDIEHPKLSVEVKAGKTISSRQQTALVQAESARRGDKVPVVLLTHSRPGNKGNVEAIMFDREWGLHVLRLAGLIEGDMP